MVREKLERIGRANVILVSAPRVWPHFLEPATEAFGLLLPRSRT